MAAIAPPPEGFYSTGFVPIKDAPVVEIQEAQPESDEQKIDSGVDEGEVSIMKKKKKPGRPVTTLPVKKEPVYTIQPVDDTPVDIMPIKPGHGHHHHHHPQHPIYNPHGSTLDNVATHMLCNDWFLKNVRELVEQYKSMKAENAKQARQICTLEREVANLKDQVDSVTAERDDALLDYESERVDHARTREDLRMVRIELCDLTKHYQHNLGELRHTKAQLGEARREISRLKVQVSDKDSRIADLEEKLRISNASEDAANDRVTQLQHVIYELERRNASLEKTKDRAEQATRLAEDCVQDLKRKVCDLEETIRQLRRGGEYHILETETAAASADFPGLPVGEQPLPPMEAQSQPDPLFEALKQPAAEEQIQAVVESEKSAVEPEQTEAPAAEE